MADLTCIVVTPEETALEETVDFVALPLFDGEIGVAPGHSPMIGRLGYGELRLGHADSARRFYVDGGFVQVADNVVTVLTGAATPAGSIDTAAAQRALDETRGHRAHSLEVMELRDRTVARSRAQLKVAEHGG